MGSHVEHRRHDDAFPGMGTTNLTAVGLSALVTLVCILLLALFVYLCLYRRSVLSLMVGRCGLGNEDYNTIDGIMTVKYHARGGYLNTSLCSNETCTVCCEDFTTDEDILLCPCTHGYHKDCLVQWLQHGDNCPMCQFKLKTDDISEYTPLRRDFAIDI